MKLKRVAPKHFDHSDFRNSVWVKTNGLCFYCGEVMLPFGRSAKSFSIDHFIPVIKGGVDDISNLVPSCTKCNVQKHDMEIEEYRDWLGEGHKFFFEIDA